MGSLPARPLGRRGQCRSIPVYRAWPENVNSKLMGVFEFVLHIVYYTNQQVSERLPLIECDELRREKIEEQILRIIYRWWYDQLYLQSQGQHAECVMCESTKPTSSRTTTALTSIERGTQFFPFASYFLV